MSYIIQLEGTECSKRTKNRCSLARTAVCKGYCAKRLLYLVPCLGARGGPAYDLNVIASACRAFGHYFDVESRTDQVRFRCGIPLLFGGFQSPNLFRGFDLGEILDADVLLG